MFKIGQRVVFIDLGGGHPLVIKPKDKEVVVISNLCAIHPNSYVLEGYPFASNGNPQSFTERWLRPIQEDDGFAEEVLANIEKQISVEQLVKI